MRTIAALFERILAGRRDNDVALVLDPGFQGLPDMAHGGTILALFDAAVGRRGRRSLRGHYRKRVPLGDPLRLTLNERDGAVHCQLLDRSASILVDGRVESPAGREEARAGPPLDTPLALDPHPLPHDRGAHELPVSRACFVCGTDNELGLQARLSFDRDTVHAMWRPREPLRGPDGALAPVALTALLDEAAFWLGALATGEAGMTTELAVTLEREPPFSSAVTLVGDRKSVTQRPDDGRYWDTEIAAFDDRDEPIATGRITFVAVRGAARKLATGMLAVNAPQTVRRVFPAYVAVD